MGHPEVWNGQQLVMSPLQVVNNPTSAEPGFLLLCSAEQKGRLIPLLSTKTFPGRAEDTLLLDTPKSFLPTEHFQLVLTLTCFMVGPEYAGPQSIKALLFIRQYLFQACRQCNLRPDKHLFVGNCCSGQQVCSGSACAACYAAGRHFVLFVLPHQCSLPWDMNPAYCH